VKYVDGRWLCLHFEANRAGLVQDIDADAWAKQDPRQFVPSTGQTWTTLGKMRSARAADGVSPKYKNVFEQVSEDSKVMEVYTEPKVSGKYDGTRGRRYPLTIWKTGSHLLVIQAGVANLSSLESVKVRD
jgi:hypothetical protein